MIERRRKTDKHYLQWRERCISALLALSFAVLASAMIKDIPHDVLQTKSNLSQPMAEQSVMAGCAP